MAYSNAQLQSLWIQAGGDKAAAPTAAAVALAESGGDPNSTGHNTDGSTDRGLWQINSVHGTQSTTNVLANVKAAIAISNNGKNWTPWVTYNKGLYKPFLKSGGGGGGGGILGTLGSISDTLNNATGFNQAKGAVDGVTGGISGVADAIGFVFSASGIDRILKVLGGGAFMLLAINELLKGTGLPSPGAVAHTAIKVAPK